MTEIRINGRPVSVRRTIADRVVEYFNPAAGLDRIRSRVLLESTRGSAGGYDAGRRDRRGTRNWRPTEGSANSDIIPDLPDLRARSRELARNNPIAGGAIATVVTNVVGEGLTLAPAVDRKTLGLEDAVAEEFESAAAREFALWSTTADFTKALSFEEMQALALRGVLESGDLFVARRYREDRGEAYGTKLLLIEGDRISNPFGAPDRAFVAPDRAGMIGGVELNGDGVATGYSVSSRHPGDTLMMGGKLAWNTAPARDGLGRPLMLHLFERLRPDQARGVPFLAPVIEKLKELGDYTEAEARAAVVTAMLTVFVTSQTGEDEVPIIGEKTSAEASNEVRLGNGAIIDLAPGEKPEIVDPLRPNPEFDAFVMAMLRQIGVALEIPFEILIKHFTASYSASRAALETAWQFFRKRRRWLDRRFCQPCYEWVIYEAVARGRLLAPGFFDDPLVMRAWCGARWRGPARISLDQSKDATADETNLRNNLVSREQIIQERFGGSIDDTFAQLAEEQGAMQRAGILPAPAPAPAPGTPPPAAPADNSQDPAVTGGNDTQGADQA